MQFSKEQALVYLKKSKELANVDFSCEAFLNDLLQSVCILIEDGLFITFSHRSFQEYFAARFIIGSDYDTRVRLLKRYENVVNDDNVYRLCHELDPDFIEYEIVYPFLVNIFQRIGLKKKVGITHYLKFTKLMWTNFRVGNGGVTATGNTKENINDMVRFVVFVIGKKYRVENYFKNGKTKSWVNKRLASSVSYNTKDLTTKDDIVIELSQHGNYFSKKLIELLMIVKKELELKKDNKLNKLEEFLFKEK